LKRFILSAAPDAKGIVRLEGADYHYLVRVRRLAAGEYFPVLLPGGEDTLIRICSVEGSVLTGTCGAPDPALAAHTVGSAAALPPVVLFQALPKGEKMDMIVRQAAEGALAEIVPFISAYSIPKAQGQGRRGGGACEGAAAPPAAAKKQLRWERIVKEARQQSGSAAATVVSPLVSIDGLFARWEELKQERPGTVGLLLHHVPLAQASLHGYLDNNPETVVLAVGPEGGFSSAEADRFLAAGFKALTIGNTVLRTETAALYGAAAIRIILLERNSWEMQPRQSGNG
jgi:16S rRNA (uracil1498-N3)-methyltransferase